MAACQREVNRSLTVAAPLSCRIGARNRGAAASDGRGADVVFESVGHPALQRTWIEGVRPGGTLVLVGLPSTDTVTEFGELLEGVVRSGPGAPGQTA